MPTSRILSGDFNFSQLKQNWMGEWNEGTIYTINDTVRLNGKAYVCTTTYFDTNKLFGKETKPGYDTTNWKLVISGSVYKGDWAFKDMHYEGDIVRFNGDFYQCVTTNFGGHPIYENGGLTTKFTKIAESSRRDKSRNHIWFCNYPPMGWTRNFNETSEMYGQSGYINIVTINGNYEQTFIGRDYGNDGWGIGERSNSWLAADDVNASGVHHYPKHGAFDFWDYYDGANTTLTGEAPRMIQLTGDDAFTYALFDNGELYQAGYGGHGQGGDSTTNTRRYYRRVGRAYNGGRGTGTLRGVKIIKVAHNAKSGRQDNIDTHSAYALDDQGRIWSWGYNGYGQLGQGNTNNYSVPTLIPQGYFHNKKVVDVWGSGYSYQKAYAITEDGYMYSWGYNGEGALGLGDFYNKYRPERVPYNWKQFGGIKKSIRQGSAGEDAHVVLCNDGSLHMCGNIGDGSYPIYGAGTTMDTYVPRFVPMAQTLFARANSLGIKSNTVGALVDVSRNCEDFWYISRADAFHLIFMKEKGTGLIYHVGHSNSSIPIFDRDRISGEYYGDNPYEINNHAFPTRVATGPMTDIKYINFPGNSSNYSVVFQNSDGRLWTNGYNSSGYAMRGIGVNM